MCTCESNIPTLIPVSLFAVVTYLRFGLGGSHRCRERLGWWWSGWQPRRRGRIDLGKPSSARFALHDCTSPSSSKSISTELTSRHRTAEESYSFRRLVGVQTSGWQSRLEDVLSQVLSQLGVGYRYRSRAVPPGSRGGAAVLGLRAGAAVLGSGAAVLGSGAAVLGSRSRAAVLGLRAGAPALSSGLGRTGGGTRSRPRPPATTRLPIPWGLFLHGLEPDRIHGT